MTGHYNHDQLPYSYKVVHTVRLANKKQLFQDILFRIQKVTEIVEISLVLGNRFIHNDADD